MQSLSQDRIGQCLNDRYQLLELISSEPHFSIYKAQDLERKEWVTALLFQPVFFERMLRKKTQPCSLKYPLLLDIIADGQIERYTYLILEWIPAPDTERHSFQSLLHLSLSESEVFLSIAQLLMALDYLTQYGVKISALTPDMLYWKVGQLKLFYPELIFENARESAYFQYFYQAESDYQAPECIIGKPVTEQSLIYTIGMIAIRLLVGSNPFQFDSNRFEFIRLEQSFKLIDQAEILSQSALNLLSRCLAVSVEDRYPSFQDMLQELSVYLNEDLPVPMGIPDKIEKLGEQLIAQIQEKSYQTIWLSHYKNQTRICLFKAKQQVKRIQLPRAALKPLIQYLINHFELVAPIGQGTWGTSLLLPQLTGLLLHLERRSLSVVNTSGDSVTWVEPEKQVLPSMPPVSPPPPNVQVKLIQKYNKLKAAFLALKKRYQELQQAQESTNESESEQRPIPQQFEIQLLAAPQQTLETHDAGTNQRLQEQYAEVEEELGSLQQHYTSIHSQLQTQYQGIENNLHHTEIHYQQLITSLSEHTEALDTQLGDVQAKYQGLNAQLGQHFDTLDTQLGDVQAKYQELNAQLGQHFDTLDTQLGDVQAKYQELNAQLGQHFDTLDTQLGDVQAKYQELNAQLSQQLDTPDIQLEGIQIKYRELHTQLGQQFDLLEDNLSRLESRYRKLTESLSFQYDELLHELEILQDKEAGWLKAVDGAQQTVIEKQEQANQLTERLEQAESTLHHQVETISNLQQQWQETESDRLRLETSLGKICQENEDLKQDSSTLKAHLKHVKHQRNSIEAVKIQLETDIQQSRQEQDALRKQGQRQHANIQTLEAQLQEWERSVALLRKEKEALELSYQSALEERDATRETLEQVEKERDEAQFFRQALKQEQQNLETLLKNAIEARNMTEKELQEKKQQLQESLRYQEQLRKLQKQYDDLFEDTRELQERYLTTQKSLERSELELQQLKIEHQHTREQATANNRDDNFLRKRLEELKQQLEDLQTIKQELLQQRQHLEQEMVEKSHTLERQRQDYLGLEAILAEVHQQNQQLQQEKQEQEKTVQNIMIQFHQQETRMTQLESLLAAQPEAHQKLITQIYDEYEQLMQQMEAMETQSSQWIDRIQETEHTLQQKTAEIQNLQTQLERKQANQQALQQENQALQTQLEMIQADRRMLENDRQAHENAVKRLSDSEEWLMEELKSTRQKLNAQNIERDQLNHEKKYLEKLFHQAREQSEILRNKLNRLLQVTGQSPEKLGAGNERVEWQYLALAELIHSAGMSPQNRALLDFTAEKIGLSSERAKELVQQAADGIGVLNPVILAWTGGKPLTLQPGGNQQAGTNKLPKLPVLEEQFHKEDKTELEKLAKQAREKEERQRSKLIAQLDLPAYSPHTPERQLTISNTFANTDETPAAVGSKRPSYSLNLLTRSKSSKPRPIPKVQLDRNEPAPSGMIYVPEGQYLMGDDRYNSESPAHLVKVVSFFMDVHPVTNADYSEFIEAGGYQNQDLWTREGWEFIQGHAIITPAFWNKPGHQCGPEYPEYPVIGVSWFEAVAYAAWVSKRLPTEAEWEAACRGPEGWEWPWGNEWKTNCVNTGEVGLMNTSPIGRYADGKSFFGCYDMIGNIMEWMNSVYKPYPYQPEDGREELHTEGNRTLRGCSWSYKGNYTRCAYRFFNHPGTRHSDIGFRCARPLL